MANFLAVKETPYFFAGETEEKMNECPVCGGGIETRSDILQGELIDCPECGLELEVKSVSPLQATDVATSIKMAMRRPFIIRVLSGSL